MTSPRKRSPGASPGFGLPAGRSRGCGSSPAPRSGAKPCRGASLGADLWPTAGEERGYGGNNWKHQGGEDRKAPHLDADVGIGVSPVEDGPEVEFGISCGSENM